MLPAPRQARYGEAVEPPPVELKTGPIRGYRLVITERATIIAADETGHLRAAVAAMPDVRTRRPPTTEAIKINAAFDNQAGERVREASRRAREF